MGRRRSRSKQGAVLLVVPWDQEFGGVASVVGNLARELERRGRRVLFFHPGEPSRPLRRTTKMGFAGYEMNLRSAFVPEHPLRSVAAFALGLVPTLFALGALLRSEDVEIVNIHYPLGGFLYFGLLRRLLPIRLVVSVHGADLFPVGAAQPVRSASLRLLMRCADALVAPSRAFLRDCLSVYPALAPRAACIHNGIDLEELAPRKGEAAPPAGAYLLCVAAHNAKKGIDVLLRAFAQIAPAQPGLRLLLAGDGPLRPQLEAQTRSLALDSRVVFLGWKSRAEVGPLLRGCRAFVLPSRAEPFGMVVAEALACGCPVVASAVGGIAEIVEDGRSGVLVPPDDPDALARALVRVLDDDALRASLAAAGSARVHAHFGREAMASGYERLYADLLAPHGPTPRRAATDGAC